MYTSRQHEHCILCTRTRSLRIPLYKAIRFSCISRIVGILFLQFPSINLLNFIFISPFLYSSPFPLGSFTFSANCTFFFFFLSLFFSPTITTTVRKKNIIVYIKENEKKQPHMNMYLNVDKNVELAFEAAGNFDSGKDGMVGKTFAYKKDRVRC